MDTKKYSVGDAMMSWMSGIFSGALFTYGIIHRLDFGNWGYHGGIGWGIATALAMAIFSVLIIVHPGQ